MKKQSAARALVMEQMPELPEGYYFKVSKQVGIDWWTLRLMRKRLWWFDKSEGYYSLIDKRDILNPNFILGKMRELAGGLTPLKPGAKLTGKYRKTPSPVPANPLTVDKEVHYDEVTQTFTLSDELIERLKNGE